MWVAVCPSASGAGATWNFVDHTAGSGINSVHGSVGTDGVSGPDTFAGGLAVGDYNADGWPDIFVVGGPDGGNALFRNQGDGTFENVTISARVDRPEGRSTSPVFMDINGDGWLDLLVPAVASDLGDSTVVLYENLRNGRFANVTLGSGLILDSDTAFSPAFADVDKDGDLDIFISRWGAFGLEPPRGLLWRNEGDFQFTDISREAGFDYRDNPEVIEMDWSLAPKFTDLDDDGYPDLVLAGESGEVRVFLNDGGGAFVLQAGNLPAPTSGIGLAVADYDNDGLLDIFTSGVFDPDGVTGRDPASATGNRLYQNQGSGVFADVTVASGVQDAGWGWSAEFGDLNMDGLLDLYVVNGAGDVADGPGWADFVQDPARLFVATGSGGFVDQASALGVADTGIGRGTVLVDLDRDGDLDIVNQNSGAAAKVYRNETESGQHFFVLKLIGRANNRQAIGARVYVTVAGVTQLREVQSGSGRSGEVHFGLGSADMVEELRVVWSDGAESIFDEIAADQHFFLRHPGTSFERCDAPGTSNKCTLGGKNRSPMECLIELKVTPTPRNDKRGGPGYRIDCRAGDPSCDADPDDTTSCSVDVALCLSAEDPRNFVCSPSTINRLDLRAPGLGSRRAQDVVTRDFGLRLIGDGVAAFETVDGSPFQSLAPGLCSAPERLTVALRQRASGALRKGSTRVKFQAFSTDGRRDLDQLLVRCSPPN